MGCSHCHKEGPTLSYDFDRTWSILALSRSPYTGGERQVCEQCAQELEAERARYQNMPDPFSVRVHAFLLRLIRPVRAIRWVFRCSDYAACLRCQRFADELELYPVLEQAIAQALAKKMR